MQFPSDSRRLKAGCLGALLGGAIMLALMLKLGDHEFSEIILAVMVSSSLGAILNVAASDPDRLQPPRFWFPVILVASIPVSLFLIFPVVALHALVFDVPCPMADVKPGPLRRMMGSPLILLFFGAAQRKAWRLWVAIVCVGIATACVAFMVNRRRAFLLMLVTTAHVLFLLWLLYWVKQLPA